MQMNSSKQTKSVSLLYQKLSLFIFIIAISMILSACGQDKHDHPNLSTGEDYYNTHCAACHKKDGTGLFLKGIPANIATNKSKTDIIFHIKIVSDENNAKMPVFTNMPDNEAQKVAHYLLQLKKRHFNNPENKDKILLERKK